MRALLVIVFICVSQTYLLAQTNQTELDFTSITKMPSKSIDELIKRYDQFSNSARKKTETFLRESAVREKNIENKIRELDSVKSSEAFLQVAEKYKILQEKINNSSGLNPEVNAYLPVTDSLETLIRFLLDENSRNNFLSEEKLGKFKLLEEKINILKDRLQLSKQVEDFVKQRSTQLKACLQNNSLSKEIVQIDKQLYYYAGSIKEVISSSDSKNKIEEKLFNTVLNSEDFQAFFKENSYLNQLFKVPGVSGSNTTEVVSGIPKREDLDNFIQKENIVPKQQTKSNNSVSYQNQIDVAKTEINTLKDKLNKLACNETEFTNPDFSPNNQKTKSFLKRIEYGINIQSQRTTFHLPATSDLALTIGYKISDKSVFGFGIAYKLGWGTGFNNIQLTNEGLGLRSYADVTLKENIWISGGFEYDYYNSFKSFNEIKNINIWQKSALLGLTKKYKIGKKTSKAQILYDFLAARQVPSQQAIKFRLGYNF